MCNSFLCYTDIPERSNQPGTMAYIAQKGSLSARDKPKGPKCGQCEERGAAVVRMIFFLQFNLYLLAKKLTFVAELPLTLFVSFQSL